MNAEGIRPYLNLFFLPFGILLLIYSVRIANHFTQIKQKALERRNLQLSALNSIGATIRRALNPQKVVDEIINAVTEGLGFQMCILALVENDQSNVKLYLSDQNYFTVKLKEQLKVDLNHLSLPMGVDDNSIFIAIRKNKVLVRNNLAELFFGIQPEIDMQVSLDAQRKLGLRKLVITPLVAENKVVGAIIGGSKKTYVEDVVIDALDNFANQAAMALEASQLIQILEDKNLSLIHI